MKRPAAWIILFATLLALTGSARAISLGQVDTFEDGTSDFWGYGFGDWGVKLGGPGGAGDHYMEVLADGNGQGGKLVAYNFSQWTGNYTLASVNAIEMDVKAFQIVGAPNLNIRLAFRSATGPIDSLGASGYVTSTAITLTVDGQWHHVVFNFSSLVPVNSIDVPPVPPPPLATLLANPPEVRIINSATGGVVTGDAVIGNLGIDNIRAIRNANILSTTRLAGGTIRLQGKGVPNTTYTIQSSPDLAQSFVIIGTAVSAADGTFQFDDTNASSFTQRFYRLKTP